ncbi:MAG: TonB-dependent receptor plug domain-containing protein, partial [Bacteroidales bacterium]|nr:TonB-dependent receptor plug domain-containing protein [Bacteroidales bacterium]
MISQSLVTIQGHITDEWGNSLENVIISVKETNSTTYSNVEGRYKLSIPANQDVIVRVHYSLTDTIITINSSKKEYNISLTLKGEKLQEIDITARYNDNYVRIDPKLNYKIPTPGGGLESLIKLLPGVSSTNELSSQYNVRGGNFDENLIYINDIEIYKSFLVRNAQQEGLSFVNLDLTNSVKFSAGGFEARYGDKMSSVMDVEYNQPTSYGGSFMASILGASGHVEGNVNDKFIFLAGIRFRSNAYLFTSLDTKGVYKPTFFDTQLQLTWKPVKKLEITLMGVFSNNSYFQRPESREQAIGTITSSQKLYVLYDGQEVDQYENYLGGLTFKYKINDNNHLRLILSSYYAQEKETFDILYRYNIRATEADLGASGGSYVEEGPILGTGAFREHARNAMNAIVSAADLRGEHRIKHSVLSWGIKFQNEIIHDRLREWSFIDSSGHILPNFGTGTPGDFVPLEDPSRIIQLPENRFVSAVNDLNTWRVSGFVQNVWNIDGDSATRFKLNTGIRFHYWSYNHDIVFSPRINFIYKPHWKNDWTFFLRTGLYYQPPFYREFRNAK